MKKLYTLFILAVLAAGCSKSNDVDQATNPTQTVQKELSSAAVPATSVEITTDGNKRTLTIRGSFQNMIFDQSYHKADGSIPGTKASIRTYYQLNYDKVVINSLGTQPFTFTRISPYVYTLVHTISPGDYETNRITLIGDYPEFQKEY